MIHSLMGGKYTHASIAVRPATDEFYSFARKKINNPLIAGFIVENIHTFVFSKFPDCNCGLYSLEVDDKAYDRITETIDAFLESPDRYGYNFLGLLPARLGIKTNRRYKFTCSQFVATVLWRSDAVELPKHPSLMMPNDFLKIKGIEQIYEGRIGDCNFSGVAPRAKISAEV